MKAAWPFQGPGRRLDAPALRFEKLGLELGGFGILSGSRERGGHCRRMKGARPFRGPERRLDVTALRQERPGLARLRRRREAGGFAARRTGART